MDLTIYSANPGEFETEANQLMEIAEVLKAAEPADKPVYMITNVLLENKPLDCILLTEKGPVLIDCKSYQGKISGCEEGAWTVQNSSGEIIELENNPFEQLKEHRFTFLRKWRNIIDKHFTQQVPEKQVMHFSCWVYFKPGSEYIDSRFEDYKFKWFKVVTRENLIISLKELHHQYRISTVGYDKIIREFDLSSQDTNIPDSHEPALIHELQTSSGPVKLVIQKDPIKIDLPIRTQSRNTEFLNGFNEAKTQFELKNYVLALNHIDYALRKDHYDKEAQDLKYDILCILGKEKEADEYLIKAIKFK